MLGGMENGNPSYLTSQHTHNNTALAQNNRVPYVPNLMQVAQDRG
jgi:hypothetical protein